MLSDEEKKAIESLIEIREFANLSSYKDTKISQLNAIDVVLNLIEKQSKEIEELQELSISVRAVNQIDKMQKEIEELKEDNKRVKFLYDDACKCLLNSVDKDKIKAKIEEVKDGTFDAKIVLQSLLEKE